MSEKADVVNEMLASTYREGAAGNGEYDCRTMAQEVRARLFNKKRLLPCGVKSEPENHEQAFESGLAHFEEVEPREGAIAVTHHSNLHVGTLLELDGRMRVLETSESSGPRLVRLEAFLAVYSLPTRPVRFFDDR